MRSARYISRRVRLDGDGLRLCAQAVAQLRQLELIQRRLTAGDQHVRQAALRGCSGKVSDRSVLSRCGVAGPRRIAPLALEVAPGDANEERRHADERAFALKGAECFRGEQGFRVRGSGFRVQGSAISDNEHRITNNEVGAKNAQYPTSVICHLSILHLASCILHPASCILHPASCILHLASCILHPASCILHPASPRRGACIPHHPYLVGSATPASAKPCFRRRHESQCPHARPLSSGS
jgi:hypothetical protein